jgi:hypothetical protein
MRSILSLPTLPAAILFLLSFFPNEIGAEAPDRPDVELSTADFRNPPLSARPRAYWDWMNGALDLDQLTRDLEEMKDKGMGGAEMWDTAALRNPEGSIPDGPPFLGPESLEAIHHCLREAKRLGLELGLVASSGWNAGGAWVMPEHAGKNIYCSTLEVEGPKKISIQIPFPAVPEKCPKNADGTPVYLREVALYALPSHKARLLSSTREAHALSDFFNEGRLNWDVPKGKWIVQRYVLTNNGQQLIAGSPNSMGPFLDYLDPAATEMHFKYILDKLGFTPEEMKESALVSMEVDSMELERGIQWTLKFPDFFSARYGYDPRPWLPALIGWTIENEETTKRFLEDYHNAVSDLLIESHYRTASKVLNEYGLELVAEAGGPGPPIWNTCPVDALKALGAVDIPRGEFWIRHRNMFLVKEIASAAHIYGKPIVDAESFTTWRRWKDSPFIAKPFADRAFCEGLNRITFHGFSHSPPEAGYPGRAYHAGYDLNPRITWWAMARPFLTYLARCCYLLQQGKPAADVCYYYGHQAPNFFPIYHDVPEAPRLPGLGAGYDFDVIDSEALLDRLSVKDGRLVLPDGVQYELLMLPERDSAPFPVLEKIRELVGGGASVLGPPPKTLPGLSYTEADLEKMENIVAEVWGSLTTGRTTERDYGKGKVYAGSTDDEVLQKEGIDPDFEFQVLEGTGSLGWIHRVCGASDLYFVRNEAVSWTEATCSFRVTDKIPSFWFPDSGEVSEVLEYVQKGNRTEVRIALPPWESTFVVFTPEEERPHLAHVYRSEDRELVGEKPKRILESINDGTAFLEVWANGNYRLVDLNGRERSVEVTNLPSPLVIEGPWTVSFTEGWGAPPEKTFETLKSWTDFDEEGIKYFSGTATYRKEIEIPEGYLGEGRRLYLDLGKVRDLAEVEINGNRLGVMWKEPSQVDITAVAKTGTNQLEVEVVNQWINRLTGDLELPPEKRFCRTNQTPWTKDIGGDEVWRIQPSGLLGPVEILPTRLVHIDLEGLAVANKN